MLVVRLKKLKKHKNIITIEQLKYPIGKFEKPIANTKDILSKWISEISDFPSRLKNEASGLTDVWICK